MPAAKLDRLLRAGGNPALEALQLALEHAIDLTDGRIAGVARKARAAAADRLETMLEQAGSIIDAIARAEATELRALTEMLSLVMVYDTLQISHAELFCRPPMMRHDKPFSVVQDLSAERMTSASFGQITELLSTLDGIAEPELEPEPEPEPQPQPRPRPAVQKQPVQPHYRARLSAVADADAHLPVQSSAGFTFEGGQHAMFSYNWNEQELVLKVGSHLRTLQIPVWIDVDGGMASDIYDSMAQGVAGAAVVIAFMSQRYQDSENCKLELKYAKQRNVPIVPVLMQGAGWEASEWLGIITAGSLWTPLYDEATWTQHLPDLVKQIQVTAVTILAPAGAAKAEVLPFVSDDVAELRAQVESLRQDLRTRSEQATDALASIPAAVPQLLSHLRPTPQMMKLKAMLLRTTTAGKDSKDTTMSVTSENANAGVSAMGMGVSGRQTLAAVCRIYP